MLHTEIQNKQLKHVQVNNIIASNELQTEAYIVQLSYNDNIFKLLLLPSVLLEVLSNCLRN